MSPDALLSSNASRLVCSLVCLVCNSNTVCPHPLTAGCRYFPLGLLLDPSTLLSFLGLLIDASTLLSFLVALVELRYPCTYYLISKIEWTSIDCVYILMYLILSTRSLLVLVSMSSSISFGKSVMTSDCCTLSLWFNISRSMLLQCIYLQLYCCRSLLLF